MDTSSRVQTVNIEDEMKEFCLSYSMSVNVARSARRPSTISNGFRGN